MRTRALIVAATWATGLMTMTAPGGNRQPPAQTPTPPESPPTLAPDTPKPTPDDLNDQERAARIDATIATARLELVHARQALRDRHPQEAARRAQRVLSLLKQLPADVDAGGYELQAEGILAKVSRAGGKTEPPPHKAEATPYPGGQAAPAPSNAPNHKERARTANDRHGYRPADDLVSEEAVRVRENERIYYQAALEGAYRDSEARALVDADDARVVPDGVISYPPDWPEKMKKRQQYAGGMIARTPSWTDKDGREWYIAVYDIHDLIYVPPDFTAPQFNPIHALRDAEDRTALRWGSQIFRGWPEDLAAGIPLLRYFGGVDDWAYRGPKYSLERQKQIIALIKAFTEPAEPGAKIEVLSP